MLTPTTTNPDQPEPLADRSMLLLQVILAIAAAGAALLLAVVR